MKINIDNVDYEVIITIRNTRRLSARVKDDLKIHVSVNKWVREKEIENFLNSNTLFFRKAIGNMVKKKNKESQHLILGIPMDIVVVSNQKKPEIYNNKIYIKDRNKINDYYKILAYDMFKSRLDVIYPLMIENIPYPTLKVRKMLSKWGVCNKRKKCITINSELIKKEEKCIDYVIIHELCHFIYFDHSKDFWNKVSEYCNDYKSIRKSMKEW